jgi:polyhydroxyalkanoate synthesis regulator phasin
MLNTIERLALAGLGLGLMTTDKAAALARDIAKAARLSTDGAQELVDEAVDRARRGREDLDARIRKIVADTVEKAGLPSREEFAALTARVEKLEQELERRSIDPQ